MNSTSNTVHRDGAILIFIHLVGLFYYFFFLIAFLLWHFPTSPDTINRAQAVVLYGSGIILWCLSSLAHRVRCFLRGTNAIPGLNLERAGTLVLIYTTAVPLVVFEDGQHTYLRLVYLSGLTIAVVGVMADIVAQPLYPFGNASAFRSSCLALSLLALLPPIHVLHQSWPNPPTLATELLRLAGWNLLGALGYLARVPERLGLVGGWKPSLYLMHLTLLWNGISYGRHIWDAAGRT
ncbi:hypothetical protein FE257_005570 [Aspergillus nanangensis]|uniref:Uncharacterized protein n=1 Tax=Aspergillus nanangensis TaxID=2582783 RepID=A0AAD4CQ72_ASPNN|nr:hypothetical protein FE257_005570 [Aspergillus nanangensis]